MSSFLFTLRQKDPKVYTNGSFCCFSSIRGEIRYDHLKLFTSFFDTAAKGYCRAAAYQKKNYPGKRFAHSSGLGKVIDIYKISGVYEKGHSDHSLLYAEFEYTVYE